MNWCRERTAAWVAVLLMVPVVGFGAPPRIGYAYPAGGQAGTVVEAELGGQYLGGPVAVIVSGEGVTAKVREHDKLPPAALIRDHRDKLRELGPELKALSEQGNLDPAERFFRLERILAKRELTPKMVRQIDQYERQRKDPKRQLNSQIEETVKVRFEIAPDAEPGLRFCRLLTGEGLSNPVRFVVGTLREGEEPEEWSFDLPSYVGLTPAQERREKEGERTILPPATVNGRILPGDVDEFRFEAREGDQMVISLEARRLVPYLADAVPGWFQAVLSLMGPDGTELAFADDFRFDPDPVVFFKVPADGEYRVRVRDSIYRGREDFVYRLTIGELPFLTGIYPLGGRAGKQVDLVLSGGNLPKRELKRYVLPSEPGIHPIRVSGDGGTVSNAFPFHVDEVPEDLEREPNERPGVLNPIPVPGLVNGAIQKPGDVDLYRIQGARGRSVSLEIFARRLGSPLDANLTVFDFQGRQIAYNDDFENPAAGLTTHHADPRLTVALPGDGVIYARVADTQHRGGTEHIYRLKVTEGRQTFALRATPSSLNARAGGSVRVTVHAVRLDGFEGPIELRLKEAPPGFALQSTKIPAGEDKVEIGISVPEKPLERPVELALEGTAEVGESRPRRVDVVPAEDLIQAFIYRHLVPVDALWVHVGSPRG